jgi:hypothetical protein
VQVNGNVGLNGQQFNININGGPNVWYIFNVTGTMMANGGLILTTGTIPPSRVFSKLLSLDRPLRELNSASILMGTYLAPFPGRVPTCRPGSSRGCSSAGKTR